MYNSNLALEIVDYLNRYRDARAIHTDELVEEFYPTPHGTVYDTLDQMVSDRLITWNLRTDYVTLKTKKATRAQIERLDQWLDQEERSFQAIREKCREISGRDWAVTRELIKSVGIPVYAVRTVIHGGQ